ncbi:hypothetical protein DERP_001275 [Dermatophagoides pteronyssinus]|uniref:Uncharacterized protein n=1 Tax=Dermatophagoides pteronyssinus TaxID=6956 RepID=A0ABQ8JE05_DERPT|nr:hypothetical protein DERP_001275 [Dermatophagoides pteronyssinus]
MINQFNVFYIVLLKPFISNLKCMEFQVDKKCIERVLIIRTRQSFVIVKTVNFYLRTNSSSSRTVFRKERKINKTY